MPKPMLKRPQTQNRAESMLSANLNQEQKQKASHIDKLRLDRLLRRPRSKQYMEMMHRLDAGGHTHNKQKVDDIIEAVRNEFPEVEIRGILLGIVAICYLGKPYEVHTLDITGQIIEHYKSGQALSGGLEKARSIAIYGGYDFIEVYVDCLRAVSSTGAVSVISG